MPALSELLEATAFPAAVLGPPERGVLGMPAMGYLRRTPGLSSGVPMNSTPAFWKALIIESIVLTLADGNPDPASTRLIVASPILASLAKSVMVILNNARPALICSLVINLYKLYNDTYGIV